MDEKSTLTKTPILETDAGLTTSFEAALEICQFRIYLTILTTVEHIDTRPLLESRHWRLFKIRKKLGYQKMTNFHLHLWQRHWLPSTKIIGTLALFNRPTLCHPFDGFHLVQRLPHCQPLGQCRNDKHANRTHGNCSQFLRTLQEKMPRAIAWPMSWSSSNTLLCSLWTERRKGSDTIRKFWTLSTLLRQNCTH